MVTIPVQFRITMTGKAAEKATIVVGNQARFTVLSSRLIRMEFSASGAFEDRPSTAFLHRCQAVPVFKVRRSGNVCEIITDQLHLTYIDTPAGFSDKTLSIQLKKPAILWHYGDADSGNLGGTARTVDGVNGATTLGKGLMSRAGWSVYDDSASQVFNNECWLERRDDTATAGTLTALDLYFFGYGHDYQGCLKDFCKVSGNHPMIPRWILGNWWSRYRDYTQDELKELVEGFKKSEIPLSVCIIDMDWHLPGWTGYTWNSKYFPDPEGFLKWLHAQGIKSALNLHPADGVKAHEKAYPAVAKAMGIDAKKKTTVPFDIEDPAFAKAYFEHLHHPLEKQGIDFWWMDWQQANVKGMDPLFMINHLHYLDLGRNASSRSFVFSRWGGLGNHRYPIGFSGDSHVTWDALAFQPYFTATAANVGFHLWSHDIGGHFHGMEDPELYTRWIQFGCFSPILRIHSSNNRYSDRRPWVQETGTFQIIRRYMQLRQSLVPYLYTLTRNSTTESVTPMRPMYFEYPEKDAAYAALNQYMYGADMIVAPYSSPKEQHTQLSRQVVWLPVGDWYDFFSGRYFKGDRFTAVYGKTEEIPVFVKAGAIVPLGPAMVWGKQQNPDQFHVQVFAGADGAFELYEDDGVSGAHRSGASAITSFSQKFTGRALTFTIAGAVGDLSMIPAKRQWTVSFFGVADPSDVRVTVGAKVLKGTGSYDAKQEKYTLVLGVVPVGESVTIRLQNGTETLLSRRDRMNEFIADLIFGCRIPTQGKHRLDSAVAEFATNPHALEDLAGAVPESVLKTLVEILYDAGIEYFKTPAERERHYVACWNNSRSSRVRFHFKSEWGLVDRKGVIPREFIVSCNRRPETKMPAVWAQESWSCSMNYGGVASGALQG